MIQLHKVILPTRWYGFKLDSGDYYGYDENGNPCMSKLHMFGNRISITCKINGRTVEKLIFMYDKCIPLDIQQILFARRKIFLETKCRVARS